MRFFISVFIFSLCLWAKEVDLPKQCKSTREFVTAYEFLKENKEFSLQPQDIMTIADKVSNGCTGAANRLITVTNLLIKAQLDSKSALSYGQKFAAGTDVEMKTFKTVFIQSYFGDYLDLPLFDALKMANSLSLEFEGDKEKVQKDFERLVKYCVSEKELDLPRPQCARIAASVTRQGQNFKEGVSKSFIALVEFITTDRRGPKRSTVEALNLAEKMVAFGPEAEKNFVTAYRYASSKSGLNLDIVKSLEFAEKMASRSLER